MSLLQDPAPSPEQMPETTMGLPSPAPCADHDVDQDWPRHELSEGLCVKSSDGEVVCLPPAAADASPVLRTLASEELDQGGADLGAGAVRLSFSACTAAALKRVASSWNPGGLPLSLRWEAGNVRGLAEATDVLRCAQFLDMPTVVDAACCELAAIMAYTCPDRASIQATLEGSAAAFGQRFPSVAVQDVVDTDEDISEVDAWMGLAPALGERGECLVEAWVLRHPALEGLPSECFRDVLKAADAMVRADPGVCELLAFAPSDTREPSPGASVANKVSHAIDVILARSSRYRHSALLTAALAAHATSEHGHPELRVRMVRALREVAKHGDEVAVAALLQVLHASGYAGGLLLEGSKSNGDGQAPAAVPSPSAVVDASLAAANALPPTTTATPSSSRALIAGGGASSSSSSSSRHRESPVAAAARRMGLDASWEVRAEACAALEAVAACPCRLDVVLQLVETTSHGYFEVRQAAAHALGCLAPPGDPHAMAALVQCLADDDWSVRLSAGKALADLVSRAEESVQKHALVVAIVPAICERLVDKSSDVRQAVRCAIRTLSRAASGAVDTLPVIARALLSPAAGRRVPLARRPSAEVRAAVIDVIGDALAALATEDKEALQEMLQELGRALADRQSVVRRSALAAAMACEALPDETRELIKAAAVDAVLSETTRSSPEEALEVICILAAVGDEPGLQAARHVLQRGTSESGSIRVAIKVLSTKAVRGDSLSVQSLLQAVHVDGFHHEVFKALEVVSSGDSDDIDSLLALASDEALPKPVRRCSLRSLGHLAPQGDERVLELATDILRTELSDPMLRGEALGVVANSAKPGDTTAKALVAARLSDSDAEVRRRALEACEKIVDSSDPQVVDAIVAHAVTGGSNVRSMALRTLRVISTHGDPVVVRSLLPWLDHGHWPQRQAALEAVAALAAQGDAEVLSCVMRRLDDCDETCRQIACEVMGGLASPGDEAAASALSARLEDGSWIVRDAAASALQQVAAGPGVIA